MGRGDDILVAAGMLLFFLEKENHISSIGGCKGGAFHGIRKDKEDPIFCLSFLVDSTPPQCH
jgi:hypothetical protein